jgi:predicted nucleic acid-binding Zn ribbon protein
MTWKPLPPEQPPPGAPVKRSLEFLAKKLGMPQMDAVSIIFERWPDAVGMTLAEHSRPLALREGVLRVVVDDSQYLTQLKWASSKVVERLNEFTSEPAVERLELRLE